MTYRVGTNACCACRRGSGEQRKLILWLVLAVGVLALGAVAFTLLRQLPVKPAKPTDHN